MYLGIGVVVMSLVVLLWWTFLFFDSALGTWLLYKYVLETPADGDYLEVYVPLVVVLPIVAWFVGVVVWPLVLLSPFAITLWFVVRHFSDKIKSKISLGE